MLDLNYISVFIAMTNRLAIIQIISSIRLMIAFDQVWLQSKPDQIQNMAVKVQKVEAEGNLTSQRTVSYRLQK